MNDFYASSVLWRRLLYFMTPQLDIYENVRKIIEGKRVLEIGFGTGIGVLQYASQAEYVDAVEIDGSAVQFARKMFPLRNVRWIHDDISNPVKNYRGYDAIIMIEVLEHIADRQRTLETLRAALTRGGHGILTVPNATRYRRRSEVGNLTEWTPADAAELVGQYFERVVHLTSGLMVREDLDHRESPIVLGVHRGRD